MWSLFKIASWIGKTNPHDPMFMSNFQDAMEFIQNVSEYLNGWVN